MKRKRRGKADHISLDEGPIPPSPLRWHHRREAEKGRMTRGVASSIYAMERTGIRGSKWLSRFLPLCSISSPDNSLTWLLITTEKRQLYALGPANL